MPTFNKEELACTAFARTYTLSALWIIQLMCCSRGQLVNVWEERWEVQREVMNNRRWCRREWRVDVRKRGATRAWLPGCCVTECRSHRFSESFIKHFIATQAHAGRHFWLWIFFSLAFICVLLSGLISGVFMSLYFKGFCWSIKLYLIYNWIPVEHVAYAHISLHPQEKWFLSKSGISYLCVWKETIKRETAHLVVSLRGM